MAGRVGRRDVFKMAGAATLLAALPWPLAARQRVVLDDASRLNPTPVHRHWIVKPDDEADLIARLRAELKAAAAAKRPVAVGAARHSMGGQSLPRDGTAITFAIDRVEADLTAKTFQVHAGTRWSHVIAELDRIGFSPAVMQSNNDFGVAGTFCVNAHGWPVPYGPFGATVRRIETMLADGSVVACSRRENPELFRLAMGGYGYFGIILKLEVEMVANVLLKPSFQVLPSTAFAPRFMAAANDPTVRMLYGRLSVAKRGFFDRALLVSYRPDPSGGDKPLPQVSGGGFVSSLSRSIYRAQVGSEAAKRARWFMETVAGPRTAALATRNSLMNEPVSNLASSDRTRTDILHEYFVPADTFVDFIKSCQELIPSSDQELLNITLRYVAADTTSVMSFAPAPRIAGVMSFAQKITPEHDAGMLRLTESLIDRVGALGGSFYLPYRLHARRDQVVKIYPKAEAFAARKRHYDPRLIFRNAMWPAYFQ
ncbi:MAG: FAD-binding protein [Hyphomicrobiaceae bacterium]